MKQSYSSGIFRMSRGSMFRRLVANNGKVWLSIGATIFTGLCIASVATLDVRWGIVGLMIICIIFPMGMALLFFSYALRQEVAFNILVHSLELCKDGLKVIYYNRETPKEGEEDLKDSELTELNQPGERDKNWKRAGEMMIPYKKIGRFDVGLESISIKIEKDREGGEGFVWLPMSAFSDKTEFEEFIHLIYKREDGQ